MRGRGDGRLQPRGGGRGRFGRGQFEPHKSIAKKGNKPEVGAYLDLPRGQAADPENVIKWLECLRIYMYSNYKSRIKEIIGRDGVLHDYPTIEEPAAPEPGADMVAVERWKSANKRYEKQTELLETDILQLYGDILGQMSIGSQVRVKEMPEGQRALDECDPLGLLTCVLATHMNNQRYGESYNLKTSIINFYNNKMLPHEDLDTYFSRCRTLLFIKAEAYRLAERRDPEQTDEFIALVVIDNLNSNYLDYINQFKNKVRPWPLNLTDAHADVANYIQSKSGGGGPPPRTIFAAHRGGRGGRGGRGRGRSDSAGQENSGCKGTEGRASTPYRERESSERAGTVQEYGTRYGRCNSCGKEGHWAKECREKPRAGKKTATARNPAHHPPHGDK